MIIFKALDEAFQQAQEDENYPLSVSIAASLEIMRGLKQKTLEEALA